MPLLPRDWSQQGEEPDYRFTLANERTFLAWIRTALAILAGGLLIDQFATQLQPRGLVVGFAVCLCVLSAVLCLQAYARWRSNQWAMRQKRALPMTPALRMLAGALLTVCAGVVGLLLYTHHVLP